MTKKINFCFLIIILLTTLPAALFAHREIDRVSDMENRYYTNPPKLFNDDGTFNKDICSDFDSYLSDNVRGRTVLVSLNSKLQYYLFNRLSNADIKNDKYDEIWGSTKEHIENFQISNSYTDEEVSEFASSLKNISDSFAAQGIDFYFCMTYSKENVYPEKYLDGVNRLSDIPNGLKIETAVENAGVKTFPIYELVQEHKNEQIYYNILDELHWNQYGAYLGFNLMIDMIKENHPEITEVSANDYIVGNTTSFRNIYGLEYPIPETSQYWDVKEPKATECTEELNSELYNIINYKEYIHYYQNPSAGNNLKILLVNDSFIRMYIKDDFAEKFSDTLSIHWDNIPNLDEIVSLYNPDIIILESADISSALENVVNFVNEYE